MDNAQCGFGYTTSDTDLAGGTANRFSGSTYAGFTHAGAGEEVADYPSGPVISDVTSITYKIAVGVTQAAGAYRTIVVYVATAQY